jgi:hypothetical protein
MSNPNVSEIIATTLRKRSKKLADNVSKNNAMLLRLRERDRVKPFSGGRVITEELSYSENGTFKRYSGYEQLNISPSEVMTAAEYDIKQAAVAVSISGLEMLMNAGEEQVIDLLEARVENAEQTILNQVALDCYSDGSADGGKQIGGLALIVSTAPTSGTVGGIDRATSTYWRNLLSNPASAYDKTTIFDAMTALYVQLVRGTDHPDLMVADNNYWSAYHNYLAPLQRITSESMQKSGFSSLRFMEADVVLDGGVGGGAAANRLFMLNTKYLKFRPHSARNFTVIGDDRYAVNQDAMVRLLGFAGNITCSNCSLQGVMTD